MHLSCTWSNAARTLQQSQARLGSGRGKPCRGIQLSMQQGSLVLGQEGIGSIEVRGGEAWERNRCLHCSWTPGFEMAQGFAHVRPRSWASALGVGTSASCIHHAVPCIMMLPVLCWVLSGQKQDQPPRCSRGSGSGFGWLKTSGVSGVCSLVEGAQSPALLCPSLATMVGLEVASSSLQHEQVIGALGLVLSLPPVCLHVASNPSSLSPLGRGRRNTLTAEILHRCPASWHQCSWRQGLG